MMLPGRLEVRSGLLTTRSVKKAANLGSSCDQRAIWYRPRQPRVHRRYWVTALCCKRSLLQGLIGSKSFQHLAYCRPNLNPVLPNLGGVMMSGKTIGLCLSGGGHRASVFSLGALLYLVDANRHYDIKAISSVSGGSLTSGFLAAQGTSRKRPDWRPTRCDSH
jgi:hypothetical protein